MKDKSDIDIHVFGDLPHEIDLEFYEQKLKEKFGYNFQLRYEQK